MYVYIYVYIYIYIVIIVVGCLAAWLPVQSASGAQTARSAAMAPMILRKQKDTSSSTARSWKTDAGRWNPASQASQTICTSSSSSLYIVVVVVVVAVIVVVAAATAAAAAAAAAVAVVVVVVAAAAVVVVVDARAPGAGPAGHQD